MNPDTQGTTNKINFPRNILTHSTPRGTNNLSYKKLNQKQLQKPAMIFQ